MQKVIMSQQLEQEIDSPQINQKCVQQKVSMAKQRTNQAEQQTNVGKLNGPKDQKASKLNGILSLISKMKPQPQKIDEQPAKSFFDQYIQILNSKILKRKVILFILNIMMSIIALIFAIFVIIGKFQSSTQSEAKIQEVFDYQASILVLLSILAIGVVSAVFSVIIIKGKVMMLHCYWLTCLVFLIIFSMVSVSAYTMLDVDCRQSSSYIIQRVRMVNLSGASLFCSQTCPCKRPGFSYNKSQNLRGKVQECPGWSQNVYGQFFQAMEQSMRCSGWCSINGRSYFTFSDSEAVPALDQQISCFDAIQRKIGSQTQYMRVLSIITCVFLSAIIFYTNYYIFMQKQDSARETRKMKRQMKQVNRRMDDQLETAQRMLALK